MKIVMLWKYFIKHTEQVSKENEEQTFITNLEKLNIVATYNVVHGSPVPFVTQAQRLEMLFLSPEERGKGIGKEVLQYGIAQYGIQEVTVNEQNPQAVGFYAHMGFETYKRTAYDEEGYPYPLIYMKREMWG